MKPRDAVEANLCQAMAELLGRDEVGIDDDFFELGGHSLLVIKLVARIRKQFGIEIAPVWCSIIPPSLSWVPLYGRVVLRPARAV